MQNIKITFTKQCTFYLTYKMLKCTIETSIQQKNNTYAVYLLTAKYLDDINTVCNGK
jgi:hypothetical protein